MQGNLFKMGHSKKLKTKVCSKFLLKTYKTTDIYLQELDYNFIMKFEKHLRGHVPDDHQKPMGNNTVRNISNHT